MTPLLLAALIAVPAAVKYNYVPLQVDTVEARILAPDPPETAPIQIPDTTSKTPEEPPVLIVIKPVPKKSKVMKKVPLDTAILQTQDIAIVETTTIDMDTVKAFSQVESISSEDFILVRKPWQNPELVRSPSEALKDSLIKVFTDFCIAVLILSLTYFIYNRFKSSDPYDNQWG